MIGTAVAESNSVSTIVGILFIGCKEQNNKYRFKLYSFEAAMRPRTNVYFIF